MAADSVVPQLTPYAGITVKAGGKDWVVPSLTAGEVVRLHRDGLTERTANAKGLFDLLPDEMLVVGLALRHNYPDLSDQQIEAFTPVELAAMYGAVWRATVGAKADEVSDPEAKSPGTEQVQNKS